VEYIVVVIKFRLVLVSFGCIVIFEKSEVFFHKILGLSGGLLLSLRFFLQKYGLQIYFQKFRGSSIKSVDCRTFKWMVAKCEGIFEKLWIANILTKKFRDSYVKSCGLRDHFFSKWKDIFTKMIVPGSI
jgi:hypothetical protein